MTTAGRPTTLVTGAGGLLGSHVTAFAARRGRTIAVDRRPWWGNVPVESRAGDLLDSGWIESLIAEFVPTVIVHCAAMTDVDGCESDPGLAARVNGVLTRRVARAAPPGCLVVFVSTDGLFSGTQPWSTEATLPCPRTEYARSKLRGEWEAQLATPDHLIVRTNFYGWSSGRKPSAGEWLYSSLAKGQAITMFDDFHFCPIYVMDLVERLWSLIDCGTRGLVHVAGAERVSKYEFAIAMAAAASLSPAAVRAGRLADARLLADRPADMSLRSIRPEQRDWAAPSCAAGLLRFIADRDRPLERRVG